MYINEQKHVLTEIEFYFTNEAHPDPYTHCNPEQESFGNWYFHVNRSKSGALHYREEQFAGVDISIGNGLGVGGILIRSIRDIASNNLYCGPGQVMERIVNLSGFHCVADMVRENFSGGRTDELSVTRETSYMYLFLSDGKRKSSRVCKSPRVGLFLTKPLNKVPLDLQIFYMLKPYRYIRDVRALWKGKQYIVYYLHLQKTLPRDIESITGLNATKVQNMIQWYEAGKSLSVDGFIGRRLAEEEELMNCFGVCDSGK